MNDLCQSAPGRGSSEAVLRILVANAKGGCGKTTIATQLAGALATAGHFTALADADRQRSSLLWLQRRPVGAARIAALDWTKEVDQPLRRTERLVVDAAPALRRARIAELVKTADLVVLPVLPSTFDEAAARRFVDRLEKIGAIAKGRKPIAVVGNRMRASTRAAERLDKFFGGIGHPIVARLRDSQLYPETAERGLSLFDAPGKRARELCGDWAPLLDFLARVAKERDGRLRPVEGAQPNATVTTS
jgi:chromosome partitioning protein